MASVTIKGGTSFPPATTVYAYPALAKVDGQSPSGASVASATPATDGTLSFTGLTDGVAYVAYALVAGQHRYVGFTAPASVTGGGSVGLNAKTQYGATGNGTTDDAAALQVALDAAAPAAGGPGVCYLPPGAYRIVGQALTLPEGVTLQGAGPGVTTLMQEYYTGDAALISGQAGSEGSEIALTVSASDTTTGTPGLVISSTSGIAANDFLYLGSSDLFVTATKGEIVRVTSVDSATQLTLRGRLRDFYSNSASALVRKLTLRTGFAVRDLTITNPNPERQANAGAPFIKFTKARQILVDNVVLHGCDSSGVRFDDCLEGTVRNCLFEDFADSNANNWFGYGVEIRRASEGIIVTGCRFRRVRHGVTTTSDRGVTRNCVISDCYADATTAPAYDTHDDCAHISFIGCSVAGVINFPGFQVRGADCRIVGGQVAWCFAGVEFGTNAKGCEVRSSTFRHLVGANSFGMRFFSNVGMVVADNTIESVGGHVIAVAGNPMRLTIVGNRLANPGRDGASSFIFFPVGTTGSDHRIERNTCQVFAADTSERGTSGVVDYGIVLAAGLTNVRVAHNTFTGCGTSWINDLAAGTVKVNNRELDKAAVAVTGSRAGNAALASLLTQLASVGLITDSSTA